jgi:hypothetical protein
MQAEDPALAAWPPDLLRAWRDLRLPSLAEQLLAYERLAAEVRRQNQELRRLAGTLADSHRPAEDGGPRLAAALESAQRLADSLARQGTEALIDLHDSCERHASALAAAVERVLAEPPRGWFGRRRPWPDGTAEALRAQAAGARLVAGKAFDRLADAGLSAIDPAPGAAFDPELHRCAGTAPGPSGRVVALELRGWRHGSTLIRPAEVIIGKDNP